MAELTPEQMTTVKAVAPFEIADIFAEWARRDEASEALGFESQSERCGGLGPPWPMISETPEDYGRRVAAVFIQLLKEV